MSLPTRSFGQLFATALAAGDGPDAYLAARCAMQVMDPNGSWAPLTCRADGVDAPTVEDILAVMHRWLAEIDALG